MIDGGGGRADRYSRLSIQLFFPSKTSWTQIKHALELLVTNNAQALELAATKCNKQTVYCH